MLLAVALFAGSWSATAPAATHPEGTTVTHEATPVDRVRIAVLDKVEGQRVIMPFPVGERIPLPDGRHSLVVQRYASNFSLLRRPQAEQTATPDQPEPADQSVGRKPEGANPAARIRLLRNGRPVAESWIFSQAPYLFQPSNMRYNFELLGAEPQKTEQSARSSAG